MFFAVSGKRKFWDFQQSVKANKKCWNIEVKYASVCQYLCFTEARFFNFQSSNSERCHQIKANLRIIRNGFWDFQQPVKANRKG
jgi:hypothetical protein